MQTIDYRPVIGIDKRFISSTYETDPGVYVDPDSGDISDPDAEDTVELLSVSREIDLMFDDLDARIMELTADMSVPAVSPELRAAASYMSGGSRDSYVTHEDWRQAVQATSDPSTILSSAAEFDLMEMLWRQIRVRICRWLADMVDDIPAIGDDLAGKLRDYADEEERKTDFGELVEKDSGRSSSVSELIGSLTTGKARSAQELMHAKNIVDAVNNYISQPNPIPFSGEAVSLALIVERYKRTWQSTKGMMSVSKSGGAGFIDMYKGDPSKGAVRRWLREEGSDLMSPLVSGYRMVKVMYSEGKMLEVAVYGTRDALMNISEALDSYVNGKDLACCLLDNLLRVSDVVSGKTLRLLKVLRMAFMFSYNGLNVSMDQPLNALIDILNQIIMVAIGKIMEKLTEALDDWVIGLITKLDEYRKTMGESMRRCSPFDELIIAAEASLEDMKDNLLGYVRDYTNTLSLAHVELTKYSIQLRKREYLRRMIGLLDSLIKGIETGAMCKEQASLTPSYASPTPEDVRKFVDNYSYRLDVSPRESVTSYSSLPDSGRLAPSAVSPTLRVDIEGDDLRWLQDCRDVMRASELEDLRLFLQEAGLT